MKRPVVPAKGIPTRIAENKSSSLFYMGQKQLTAIRHKGL